MSSTVRVPVVAFVFLLACCASAAAEPPDGGDTYPLDGVSREVPANGKVKCPKVELTRYEGKTLKYHKPVRVYVGFVERLQRFEEVVRDTAIEVYGRAPRVIRHLGTYNCRRIGGYPTYISEHGLGNGIDVAGFDFGPLPKGTPSPEGMSKRLRRSFKVRMLDHWTATRGSRAVHSRFLRTLARRLVVRKDIFRVLLGPAWPGHANHFHFDMSPWRIVEIFEAGE